MAWLGEQWRRLSLLLKREQRDRELREEIALHRELRAEKLQGQGLSMDEAAAQAQRRMGNVLLLREQTRDAGGWPWLEALAQDLRYGLRAVGKNPGFTFVIVISLAVGIGANTVVFSILDALLLKPLPYPQAERLVNVWERSGPDAAEAGLSLRHYFDIRLRTEVFEETGVALNGTSTLTGAGEPEMIEGLSVSSGFLRLVGARPLFGRLILPEDDGPGKPTVAVLTYGLCNRLFGGSSNVVGKSIILNGLQHTVIGVLVPGIPINQEIIPQSGIANVEILLSLPLPADAAQNTRYGYYSNFHVMVRLKRDVSLLQAQAAADTLSGRMRQAERLGDAFRLALVPLREQVVAGNIRSTMLALVISVSLVLLIACVNVANLLLSRAAGRRKEIAIRTALGARGARLVRQLLTESTLLGVLGGAAGLALAAFGLYVMRAINPGNIPRLDAITVDNRVLAFTFGISILTGLLFGLAPALRASDIDLNLTLKAGEWTARGSGLRPSRRGLRNLLVICELAFSLMLLTSAGLLIRSFVRLQEVSPGFNADHVVSLRLRLSGPKYYNIGAWPATYHRMLSGIETLPGVKARGAVSVLPFAPAQSFGSLEVEGYPRQSDEPEIEIDQRSATPGYFPAMEIPLLKGRLFDSEDRPDGLLVALIDAKTAQRFWPGADAIGKRVRRSPNDPWRTVVGIVGSVKQYGLAVDQRMAVYYPLAQMPRPIMYLVARTSSDPVTMSKAIIGEIRKVDPDLPVPEVRTMQDRIDSSLVRQRFSMTTLTAFAAFAVLLAGVGVYGVMSCLVAQNTRVIGVHVALGAPRASILWIVIREGMTMAGTGIAAGLIGAVALARVITSLLFGVSGTDPLTFSTGAALLGGVALMACCVPAYRATRVDPIVALREG